MTSQDDVDQKLARQEAIRAHLQANKDLSDSINKPLVLNADSPSKYTEKIANIYCGPWKCLIGLIQPCFAMKKMDSDECRKYSYVLSAIKDSNMGQFCKEGKHYIKRDDNGFPSQPRKTMIHESILSEKYRKNTLSSTWTADMIQKLQGITNFNKTDISGVTYRLSAALGFYANHGMLDCQQIRGDNIRSINEGSCLTKDYGCGIVLPTNVIPPGDYHTFIVIAAAANYYGTCVYSDFNHLLTYEHMESSTKGLKCANACYKALHILITIQSVYGKCSDGVLAMVRGIHGVVSVLDDHTKMDSSIREIIIYGEYSPPYGIISVPDFHFDLADLCKYEDAVLFVDSIALLTAALTAIASPKHTNFSISEVNKDDPENSSKRKLEMKKGWHHCFSLFDSRYMQLLSIYFGENGTNTFSSSGSLMKSFNSMSPQLYHPSDEESTILGYYWIEPTGVLPFQDSFSSYGEFDVLCYPSISKTHPAPLMNINVDGKCYITDATKSKTPLLAFIRMQAEDNVCFEVNHNNRLKRYKQDEYSLPIFRYHQPDKSIVVCMEPSNSEKYKSKNKYGLEIEMHVSFCRFIGVGSIQ